MNARSWPRPLDLAFPLIAIILVWPMVARYEPPIQDRDFSSFSTGATDFVCNYLGSLAFIRGFDPYLNGRPEFRDPWRREILLDGVAVSQYYLPGHFIALAPLAWVYQDDWEAAAKVYFWIQMFLLALLALIVGLAAGRSAREGSAGGHDATGLIGALTFVLLSMHVGIRVGLERGQSDVVQAALFWAGVLFATTGQMALAGFLLVAGTSLKGYGAVLTLGMAVALYGRRGFRGFLLGALCAAAAILALTWRYVITGLKVATYKAGDFSYHWTVHGFKHIGWAISPEWADAIRILLTLFAFAASLLCWRRFRFARPEEATFRLVIAATASLATMVGFSASSHAYNLVLVLPGIAWLATLIYEDRVATARRYEMWFAVAFFLIVLRTPVRTFAPAAYGLVLLLLWSWLSASASGATNPLASSDGDPRP